MVLDKIENASRYLQLGKGIANAFHYILNNDLAGIQPGRYEIEGDLLVMMVFESDATNTNERKLEGHRRYIDLQYWVNGSELMGHAFLNDQPVLDAYSEKSDCGFYDCQATYTRLLPGMFVIYYPTDLHTAVLDPLCNTKVKKIVFKIMVQA
jgi:YhcH/YjgK/YiaL family protein